ncbi:MAG TPA: maleylpyruvate isomerase family mycothiol-dependent enzyme, partial [Ilumatobacteraceae bacterium]|nr:maleylpyruvate isomerase family mycothiol-dependent enzyme [Ilumatobacteraceae bacterium]
MSSEVVDRTTRLIRNFDERVQAAPPDSWSNQAPCEEWTARDVVTHVGNNLFGIAAGLGSGDPRQITPEEDIVSAWDEARQRFLGVLPSADLTTNLPGPFGPMPAEELIGRLIATDVLVHTWDLARA